MDTRTGEVKSVDQLTAEEKASGNWIPIAKKYMKKLPLTDADRARVIKAEERRQRRSARSLSG